MSLSCEIVYADEIDEAEKRKNEFSSTNYSLYINEIKRKKQTRKQQINKRKKGVVILKKICWMNSVFYGLKGE